MKWKIFGVASLLFLLSFSAQAVSSLDGDWTSQDNSQTVHLTEFNQSLTLNTRSFYSNGAAVDWFFEFTLPANGVIAAGQVLPGRVRSLDGFYSCSFDEPAQAELDMDGHLRLHFPLLAYTLRTTSVGEDVGYNYQRSLSWDGWEWVESIYYFPIRKWHVVSSECVIKQRIPTTAILSR